MMEKYSLGSSIWVLALVLTLSIMLPVNCFPVSPSSSPDSTAVGLAFEMNNSHEAGRIRQVLSNHSVIESRRSTAKINVRTEPLSDTLRGASVGTGWPTVNGYVVTSNHVVSGSDELVVISTLGEELPARIALKDQVRDIALLEVSHAERLPPALPLSRTKARLGTSVFTIGFPRVHVMGKTPKLFTGVISSVNGLHDDPASYHTTVPIQPGNSGGPLLNMKGEVVGVVTSVLGLRDKENGNIRLLQNASCVLKIAGVKELLHLLPKRDSLIETLPRSSGSLEALAARIEDSILIVVARKPKRI